MKVVQNIQTFLVPSFCLTFRHCFLLFLTVLLFIYCLLVYCSNVHVNPTVHLCLIVVMFNCLCLSNCQSVSHCHIYEPRWDLPVLLKVVKVPIPTRQVPMTTVCPSPEDPSKEFFSGWMFPRHATTGTWYYHPTRNCWNKKLFVFGTRPERINILLQPVMTKVGGKRPGLLYQTFLITLNKSRCH